MLLGICWSGIGKVSVSKGFICWLAVQDRLQTTQKLARYGISNSYSCLICVEAPETHSHLFFQCKFNSSCLQVVKNWLDIQATTTTIQGLSRWIHNAGGQSFKNKSCMLCQQLSYIQFGNEGIANIGMEVCLLLVAVLSKLKMLLNKELVL